jgi:hypothetical protein
LVEGVTKSSVEAARFRLGAQLRLALPEGLGLQGRGRGGPRGRAGSGAPASNGARPAGGRPREIRGGRVESLASGIPPESFGDRIQVLTRGAIHAVPADDGSTDARRADELGFRELKTPEEVDRAVAEASEPMLLVVNSICGCAAGVARPGVARR